MAVEMATGHSAPVWPLPDVTRKRYTFGAKRVSEDGTRRRHAGLDMYAPRGSTVLATEGGVIVRTYKFNGPLAHAVVLQTDTGPMVLYGEVEPGSWKKYGHAVGSRVERGQPIADIGINPGGDQMLHYEMYRRGTTKNWQWLASQGPPRQLLNPTNYMKLAEAESGDDIKPDDIKPDDIEPDDDIKPDVDPIKPDLGTWSSNPLVLIGFLAAAAFLDSKQGRKVFKW